MRPQVENAIILCWTSDLQKCEIIKLCCLKLFLTFLAGSFGISSNTRILNDISYFYLGLEITYFWISAMEDEELAFLNVPNTHTHIPHVHSHFYKYKKFWLKYSIFAIFVWSLCAVDPCSVPLNCISFILSPPNCLFFDLICFSMYLSWVQPQTCWQNHKTPLGMVTYHT